MANNRETDDDYAHVVGQLGPKHRLVECKDNIQWIFQTGSKGRWRNVKFLTSRAGVAGRVVGLPGADALVDTLPERYRASHRGLRAGTEPSDAA